MIAENLSHIRAAISQAAGKAGRKTDEITLVAVSKTVAVETIGEAVACGQVCFGENYLKEAAEKIPRLPVHLSWHFIGHLQSNKVRQAVELFSIIETVDQLKTAQLIDKYSKQHYRTPEILVQVNTGREPQKSGVFPEKASELILGINSHTELAVAGLMTMPPYSPDPEQSRPFFRELRLLAKQLAEKGLFKDNDRVALSMGMSHDFPVAIEEGATILRVGTALFGKRML